MSKEKSKHIFTKKDYESDMGFSTYIWGPAFWHVLHTISFNYPVKPTKEDKKNYITFIKSLQFVLPCGSCRENFKKNINAKETKLTMKVMKNRESLSRWLNNLHNTINKQLGKDVNVKYEDSRDFYEQFRAKCTKPTKKQHGGCHKPYHNAVKSKTVLRIIPREKKVPTLKVDKKCLYKKKN